MAISVLMMSQLDLMADERDPFVSSLDLEKQKASVQVNRRLDLSQFVLKGIIWNEKLGVAIINDELFMVGDVCRGLKIKTVDRNAVTLTDGTDSFELAITDEIATPARTQLAQESSGTQPKEALAQKEAPVPQTTKGVSQGQRSYPQTGVRQPPQTQQGRSPMSSNMRREQR